MGGVQPERNIMEVYCPIISENVEIVDGVCPFQEARVGNPCVGTVPFGWVTSAGLSEEGRVTIENGVIKNCNQNMPLIRQ